MDIVVRLPTYHCQYNATELIWAQVKSYVAKKNHFKKSDLLPLVKEAIESISSDNWANDVRHAEDIKRDDASRDVCIDKYIDSFVIDVASSDEDSS